MADADRWHHLTAQRNLMNTSHLIPESPTIAKRLGRWARKHWVISGLLLLVLLWWAYWWHFNTPIRNPWPKEAFTIKGRFPFDKGYELAFRFGVHGEASWHRRACGGWGFFTDEASCSGGWVYVKPRQIDGQHYEITLYRDYYLPGLVQWSRVNGASHLVFKPTPGVDPQTYLITSQARGKDSPDICDDSEVSYMKRRGKLFCMAQYTNDDRSRGYKKYIHLQLPPSAQAGPNEEVRDFWLKSELDELIKQTTPAVQSTPSGHSAARTH
jgi:hypothetical protein